MAAARTDACWEQLGDAPGRRPPVACVWLPQLPLRVEVLRQPALDGRPLVLGGGPGERKVVQLCSAEAERAGVRPGLPLREVLPLCREAVVLRPDPVRLAGVLEEVVAALQTICPLVEPCAISERVFLDLRGLAPLYGRDLGNLARAIRMVVPPALRPRIGVAAGKFVAAAAARSPGSEAEGIEARSAALSFRAVPIGRERAFLAPLPVDHLPLTPQHLDRLVLLGLRAIGDVAALPFGAFQAQLGPAGARAWRLANGQDDEPVIPRRVEPVVRAVLRLDDPLGSVDAVMAALARLLDAAFADPLMHARSARQARLRALLSDGTSWERLFTFKEPLSEREAVRRALRAKLELPNGLPPAPIEEIAIELLGLGGEAARQGNLFVDQPQQLGKIAAVAGQLRARYGRVPLYHAVEVEPWSRIPERRWALTTCVI